MPSISSSPRRLARPRLPRLPLLLPALLLPTSTISSSSSSQPALCVTSADSSLRACVDPATGFVSSLTIGSLTSPPISLSASTSLGDGAIPLSPATVSQPSPDAPITITRVWQFNTSSLPTGVLATATVTDLLTSSPTSVHWHVTVQGDASSSTWTYASLPILTSLSFGSPAASLPFKIWAPWDRGSYNGWSSTSWVDPLQPSDLLPGGWWDGCYRLGSPRGGGCDYITSPLVSLLSANPATSDTGFSVVLSPADPPLDTWLYLRGTEGGFDFTRNHHRISPSPSLTAPVSLDLDLVAHAADWRGAMAWAVETYSSYFQPVNPEVFACCAGTGSYSWYIGNLTNEALNEMDYAVNWDLSGRFFPYMGMFLPPFTNPDQEWLNDPEGSQARANVSFNIIGSWYRQMLEAGFTDLSYGNINEFGINIVLPPTPPMDGSAPASSVSALAAKHDRSSDAPFSSRLDAALSRVFSSSAAPTCATTWENASDCLAGSLLDSLVTSSWDEIGQRVVQGPYYSWQNAIVVDPGVDSYHTFMLEQLIRHISFEDAFAGYIIDRSDWQDVYNLNTDDGISFLPEVVARTGGNRSGVAGSMKVSYANMVQDLRSTLDAIPLIRARADEWRKGTSGATPAIPSPTPFGSGILLVNTVGNGRLDNFRFYDGSFSEGSAVNGVGTLGVASPAILWTYDAKECCATPEDAAVYFQTHIYMGVAPMIPFPGNDHSIDWDDNAVALYSRYGGLFRAVANKVWALFPHIVSVVNSTGSTYAKVNAFVTVVNISSSSSSSHSAGRIDRAPDNAAGLQQALVLPIVRGLSPNGTVTLNLTSIDRVWGTGGSVHPLLASRQKRAELMVDGATAHSLGSPSPPSLSSSSSYTVEVLYPGEGDAWKPLTTSPGASFLLDVPLLEGCAVVRVLVAG